LIIICFISFSSWGQTSKKLSDNFTLVTGRQYKGAILSADQHTPKLDETMTSRFTPTINEVDKLENELKRRIKEINKNRPGQGRHYGPKVDKHLRRYIRQYIGFINDKNEKVIYVGLHWKGRAHNWKHNFVMVLDGGSYHWSIEYNLDRDEFFQFGVNGISSVPNGSQQSVCAIAGCGVNLYFRFQTTFGHG